MGEAMDQHIEVMEKMRKRLECDTGHSVSLDEIVPDEAWNEEFASWEEGNGSYCDENDYNNFEVDFKVGDIVKLNSSDILMTIKSIDNDILTCRWFDKNDTLQSAIFNKTEIYLVNGLENNQNYIESETEISEIDIDEDEIPF